MFLLFVIVIVTMYATLYTYRSYIHLDMDHDICRGDRFNTVHLCSDVHVDVNSPSPVMDHVKHLPGWRVLLKGQTDATQNGIYEISEYNMIRSSDANDPSRFKNGKSVYILHGRHYGETLQTIQVQENMAPKDSYKPIHFVPYISTITQDYGFGKCLTKSGKWIPTK